MYLNSEERRMSCRKCDLLMELFERTPLTNRDYWVMTELFVLLHDGNDYCNRIQSSKPKAKNGGENE